MSFTQLIEEIGELAKDINFPELRKKPYDIDNLKGEFADVFLQLCILADIHQIDIKECIDSKVKILKNRHGI